ncbi:MAG: hypothetical protein IIC50_07685 [Planctomycetes bacterium]|nr:hypothetical protein [Planctomycetota bacterium]
MVDADESRQEDRPCADPPDFLEPDGGGEREPPERTDATGREASLMDRFKDEDLLDPPNIEQDKPLYDLTASAETPVPRRRHPWYLDIFCYPANRPGLSTLGVMVGVPLVLIGLSLASYPLMPAAPILIFVMVPLVMAAVAATVIMLLYFLWYLCTCVRDSAAGGLRAPETLGQTPGVWELFGNLFQVGVCVGLFLALGSMTYGVSRGPIGCSLFCGILVFCFPLCLLSVISVESLGGLNPLLLLRNLVRVFLPYCGLVTLLLVLHGSVLRGMGLLQAHHSLSVPWALGVAAVEAYLLLVSAHLLGRFSWKNRDRLDW